LYALAFVIIGLSLMSLVVTSVLQQQAMGRPKFTATPLGITCGSIYDSIQALNDKLYSSDLTEEETKEFVALALDYGRICQETWPMDIAFRPIPPALRNNVTNSTIVSFQN
jgi:hypothetical protein